jgi:hypothetical protein
MERIICAAIWYKDLPTQKAFLPTNIIQGIVVSGLRHGFIIQIVKALTNLNTVTTSCGEYVQGFLTSENRFLNRSEAHSLFIECGGSPEFSNELYSEDLY